ncbi:Hypothetical predicted protein [Xyrichtys novacula]|uniref:Uncharacterized protein n=1 Tax=Xyrichtys novacula TaxID=13765 RepID=A0AAV1HTE4_XYRNO|nr:Hypothetical predicted protein [Xyrichtys novacula]
MSTGGQQTSGIYEADMSADCTVHVCVNTGPRPPEYVQVLHKKTTVKELLMMKPQVSLRWNKYRHMREVPEYSRTCRHTNTLKHLARTAPSGHIQQHLQAIMISHLESLHRAPFVVPPQEGSIRTLGCRKF